MCRPCQVVLANSLILSLHLPFFFLPHLLSLPLSLILCSFQLVLLYSLIALIHYPSIALAFSSLYFFPHLVLLSSSSFLSLLSFSPSSPFLFLSLSSSSLSLPLFIISLNEWMDKKGVHLLPPLGHTRGKR